MDRIASFTLAMVAAPAAAIALTLLIRRPRAAEALNLAASAISLLSILAIGLGAILWPDHAASITAAAGVVGTAVGWLASALGVVYRPTAQPTAARALLTD